MMSGPGIFLLVGLCLLTLAGLWGRFFVQKRSIMISKPLFTPSPELSTIAPHIKHSIIFRIPKSIRSDESSEVSVEYFQGQTWALTEELNSWLYEKLEVIPRALPNAIRGCFTAISSSHDESPYRLQTNMSAKATSASLNVAPEDWQKRSQGSTAPFRWRWSISCESIGRQDLILQFNDGVRSIFPADTFVENPMFQIEVTSPTGLTGQQVRIVKATVGITGAVVTIIASFVLGLPLVAEWATTLLQG